MSSIQVLENTPEISFIDDKTVDDISRAMVADFEAYLTAAEGRPVTLPLASPHRMILQAAAVQIYQAMQYIDRAGKQNLLKYAYADYLDNLALLKGVTRLPAAAATVTIRFTLSMERDSVTVIPQGTRVSAGGDVYFSVDEYTEVPAGTLTADVPATCGIAGTVGNGFGIGELTTLVDPIPFVASVSNTTVSTGGADVESDSNLAERIYLAPGAYSTAGPELSYLYHAKAYSPAVGDVVASNDHEAGNVHIIFLQADGSSPGPELIDGLRQYLMDGNVRPMTDLVEVSAPEDVAYSIDLTYYINQSDSSRALAIQTAVTAAVAEYQRWQRAIGRDINPSKLVALVMAAGAKRVEVTAPTYTPVDDTSVPSLSGEARVTYGGLEHD